jgi:hypothetical protein
MLRIVADAVEIVTLAGFVTMIGLWAGAFSGV